MSRSASSVASTMTISVPFLLILGKNLSLCMVANDSGIDEAAQIELLRSEGRHGGWQGDDEVDVADSFKLHSSQRLRSAESSTEMESLASLRRTAAPGQVSSRLA